MARVIVVQRSGSSWSDTFVVVSDARQGATYVLPGNAFYVSDEDGMLAIQLLFGTLHVWPSLVAVSRPNREVDAIARFASELTHEGAIARMENRLEANIGEAAPSEFYKFFVRGSQPAVAEIVATELRERVLRIVLRSYDGTQAIVCFDVARRRISRKQIGR